MGKNQMKKIKIMAMFGLAITLLASCGTQKAETEGNAPLENPTSLSQPIEEDGFYTNDEQFITFKEVQDKFATYQELYRNEDFDEAYELSDWLKAYNQQNGLTEEQIVLIQDNNNPIINLDEVKKALEEVAETKDLTLENKALMNLEQFKQADVKDKDLQKIYEKYQKETEEIFNSLAKELNQQRPSKVIRSDRFGSGNEDYDEDGKYIDHEDNFVQ